MKWRCASTPGATDRHQARSTRRRPGACGGRWHRVSVVGRVVGLPHASSIVPGYSVFAAVHDAGSICPTSYLLFVGWRSPALYNSLTSSGDIPNGRAVGTRPGREHLRDAPSEGLKRATILQPDRALLMKCWSSSAR